jgi:multiple sugar transport system substrate-binding protein
MTIRPRVPLLVVLLAALSFSACGPSTPAVSPTVSPPPTSTVTATPTSTRTPTPSATVDMSALRGTSILIWHAFVGQAAAVLSDQMDRFNTGNEWGITVSQAGYGDQVTLYEAVNAALQAGSPPEMVAALPEQTLEWDASAKVVDLSPYISHPDWGLPEGPASGFVPVFWAQDTVKGRQLGVPAQRSARFLFYNQTWAHELGFTHPPASADEFRQQACAANASFLSDRSPQNDGYGGWIVDTDWQATYAWLLAFGGGVLAGDTYGFRTDPNLAALQFLKSLFDDHCAWISTEPTPYDAFVGRFALFVSGDLAELPIAAESLSRRQNSDEWTLLAFPGSTGSALVAYGPSYNLLRSTPEKQMAAWLFIRWLVSPENQSRWVESTGLFPLLSSGPDQVSSSRSASPQWEAAVGDLSVLQGVPQLASWRIVRYVLEDGTRIIFQNNLSLEEIPALLTEMDSTAKDLSEK